MSDTEQAADAAAEEEAVAEGAVAVAESAEAEPVQEASEESVADLEAEVLDEAIPVPMAAPARQARILLCERGHRTVAVWSTPAHCHARPTRSGPECGRQLYPIGELPEQVQKALNPLKASKKASKG
jgi:hypothetical protein